MGIVSSTGISASLSFGSSGAGLQARERTPRRSDSQHRTTKKQRYDRLNRLMQHLNLSDQTLLGRWPFCAGFCGGSSPWRGALATPGHHGRFLEPPRSSCLIEPNQSTPAQSRKANRTRPAIDGETDAKRDRQRNQAALPLAELKPMVEEPPDRSHPQGAERGDQQSDDHDNNATIRPASIPRTASTPSHVCESAWDTTMKPIFTYHRSTIGSHCV